MEAFGEDKPFAQGFYQKAMERQADPQWVAEVLGRAKQMREQGLPTAPYFLKANEGLTKKVPPRKILPALNKTQRQTQSADRLVKQAVSRGATVPSPQSKRQAILDYQRALWNKVPVNKLKALSQGIDPRTRPVGINQLGKAANDLQGFKKIRLSHEDIQKGWEKRGKGRYKEKGWDSDFKKGFVEKERPRQEKLKQKDGRYQEKIKKEDKQRRDKDYKKSRKQVSEAKKKTPEKRSERKEREGDQRGKSPTPSSQEKARGKGK